jgi:hypothetical protein
MPTGESQMKLSNPKFAEKIGSPVFVGKTWALEVGKRSAGKITGYIVNRTNNSIYAINDPFYPVTEGFKPPKTIIRKLEVLMRKAGWIENVYAKLKPEYLNEIAAKGNGRRLPSEFENTSLARIYFQGDVNYRTYVQHYSDQPQAYRLWLALPKGVLCAFRGRGDASPVYHHDFVDRG